MSSSSPADDSPTQWVDGLRRGDSDAPQKLWEVYFAKLVRLARTRMHGSARRVSDEEDVALSAIDSFIRGIENGRFPQLANRDDLWRLLVTITLNKARHVVRDAGRQKRGGGWTPVDPAGTEWMPLDDLVSREPTPQFAAQIVDQIDQLLVRLENPTLAQVAVLKMEGHTNEEIAARLNVGERTIERKLRLIRDNWEREAEGEGIAGDSA